ncbi:MAG: YceK/YidQ family lipoprotein [Thalassotalea sp.]
MKTIIGITLVLFICSCATIKTVEPTHNHVDISHGKYKSNCKSIPRIYSGTYYNICILYGEPNKSTSTDTAKHSFHYWAIDSAFSIVSDTVILPYTIYSQIDKGSLDVN